MNPRPGFANVDWIPPQSDEQREQQDHESKAARQQKQNDVKQRLGISELTYSPGPDDEDGYGDEITNATHFPSGNPRASTMFGRQPSPLDGLEWRLLTPAEAKTAKNKIARHHTKRRKQGLPFETAYPDDRRRPPTQQSNELYNGPWEGPYEERTVFYPTIP